MGRLLTTLILLLPVSVCAEVRDSVAGISTFVYEVLNEAQELYDEGLAAEAITRLTKQAERRMNYYETGQVYRLMGHFHFQERDYDKALLAYREAGQSNRLPDSFIGSLLEMEGRVGLLTEDFDLAIEKLSELLALRDQDRPQNRMLLASAYMQNEDYAAAEVQMKVAIDAQETAGHSVPENWLLMLVSSLYQQDKFDESRDVLHRIVLAYPRERHLINLAAMHGQLGETDRQLALVESLLDHGRISEESHLRMLYSLFMSEQLPFKAAKLMAESLDAGRLPTNIGNLEKLSQAWHMAGNVAEALPPLKAAAEMSEAGRLHMRLAQLYMDNYQWQEAIDAALEATDRGEIRDEGRAWLMCGMASTHLRNYDLAKEYLGKAKDFETTAQYAEQWLRFVAGELALIESMEAKVRR